MKKILAVGALLAVMLSFGAVHANEIMMGVIYKGVVQPGQTSSSVKAVKVGTAKCKSFFGIVAVGNCSINQAMKNGKISTLSYFDEDVKNILGYKVMTVKAYGQ